MRLVNYDEFCRMPAGTIFAPYEPYVLKRGLEIKTDTGWDCDSPFYSKPQHYFNGTMPLEPWIDVDAGFENVGDELPASFEIYDGSSADYMDDNRFLVFDEADIDRLINALIWAKNGCEGECDCSVDYMEE